MAHVQKVIRNRYGRKGEKISVRALLKFDNLSKLKELDTFNLNLIYKIEVIFVSVTSVNLDMDFTVNFKILCTLCWTGGSTINQMTPWSIKDRQEIKYLY
jgi:hypothetical protein